MGQIARKANSWAKGFLYTAMWCFGLTLACLIVGPLGYGTDTTPDLTATTYLSLVFGMMLVVSAYAALELFGTPVGDVKLAGKPVSSHQK